MVATVIPRDTSVLTTLKKRGGGGKYIQQFTFSGRLRKVIKLVVSRLDIVISRGDMISVNSTVRSERSLYRVKRIWYGTEVITIKAVKVN